MKLLLDTHILLWWLDDPSSLSKDARNRLTDGATTVLISAASIWEMTIKQQLGKLSVPHNIAEVIEKNRFTHLPITYLHAMRLRTLPALHRDPFDRMLIAQALHERCPLVTRDPMVRQYRVEIIEG